MGFLSLFSGENHENIELKNENIELKNEIIELKNENEKLKKQIDLKNKNIDILELMIENKDNPAVESVFSNIYLLKIIASFLDPVELYKLSKINKLCQKEFSPKVINIDSTEYSHFIKTDYLNLMIEVDPNGQCCETGPSSTIKGNIKKFKKSIIVGIELDPPEESLPSYIENNLKNGSGEYLSIYVLKIYYRNIEDKLKTIYFAVGNSHNGYYAHSAEICINGKVVNSTYL